MNCDHGECQRFDPTGETCLVDDPFDSNEVAGSGLHAVKAPSLAEAMAGFTLTPEEFAAKVPHFDRAMMALDAEDHFSDRHDPEALLGEDFEEAYLEAKQDGADDVDVEPEISLFLEVTVGGGGRVTGVSDNLGLVWEQVGEPWPEDV